MNLQSTIKTLITNSVLNNIETKPKTPYFFEVKASITSTTLTNKTITQTMEILQSFEKDIQSINENYDNTDVTLNTSNMDTFYRYSFITIDKSQDNIDKFINDTIGTIINLFLELKRTKSSMSDLNEYEILIKNPEALEKFISNIVLRKMYTQDVFSSTVTIPMIKLFMNEQITINDINDILAFSN